MYLLEAMEYCFLSANGIREISATIWNDVIRPQKVETIAGNQTIEKSLNIEHRAC